MTRVLTCMIVPFLALLAFGARAGNDWIDDLPSVTTVAHAATEELKVTTSNWKFDARGIALKDDDDLAAVTLVGTLILMRKIMLYKYNQEPALSREREAKLRSIVAAYLEAELLIGQATGNRRGYLTTAHRCRDIECYRRWFANDISNIFIRAEYRTRILKRLYPCGERALELDQLAQSHGLRAPSLPSPAVTLTIDPAIAGVGPSGCTTYGGDANRNGLCDDWENVSAGVKPAVVVARAANGSDGIRMTKLRNDYTTPGRGLRVSIAKDSVVAGSGACFRVLRADRPSLGAGKELWHGAAKIESGTGASAPLNAVVAPNVEFKVDEKSPFLLVEITSGPSYGAVNCEQPLKTWEQRHLDPGPSGLHGPYRDIDAAMKQDGAGLLALRLTKNVEIGYLVVRNGRLPKTVDSYYVTPPTLSTQGFIGNNLQPQVPPEDFYRSFQTAFEKSCEDPEVSKVAALVHTHPKGNVEQISNFSMDDFNQALDFVPARPMQFGAGNLLDTELELTVMLDVFDRCIRAFDPRLGGDRFSLFDTTVVPSKWSDLYLDYTKNRVRKIGCAPP
jgi:hypothetical protein